MAGPSFQDFAFDDDNDSKFAEHGLTTAQVADALYIYEFTVRRNRRRRTGLYLLIGRNMSGVCVAIPVQPWGNPVVWRPVTAWPCKPAEERQLRR